MELMNDNIFFIWKNYLPVVVDITKPTMAGVT